MGLIGWQSGVDHLICRDYIIGWNQEEKRKYLYFIANNSRFLIFPWIKISHLASHILGRNIRRLNEDWNRRYGHGLAVLETFVDPRMFKGISYQASNWVKIGESKGFSKEEKGFHYHGNKKEVYLYVIEKKFRQIIKQNYSEPILTREFLLSKKNELEKIIISERRIPMIIRHEGWHPLIPPGFELTEKDVELLAQELETFHKGFEPAFKRIEQINLSRCYLQGLLSNVKRKSVEPMALKLKGPKAVRSLQFFISTYEWNDDFLGNYHKHEASNTLADPDGVISIDSSEIIKKGKESVGVARQYCGSRGKVDNCQSGVFAAYASSKGYALLESKLYMPKNWFSEEQKERRKKCKVPEDLCFKTKPEIAAEMVCDLKKTNLFPGRWITCDCSFGNNSEFLQSLPKDLYYFGEVPFTKKVWIKAPSEENHSAFKVADLVNSSLLSWQHYKLGEGAKGPIIADISRIRVFTSEQCSSDSAYWLFLRNDLNGDIKYYLSNAPENVAFEEMARVCTLRWPIEQCFHENKSELGMDHYEHRSWIAWHRHMRFVFLAQLFLLQMRTKLKKKLQR